MKTIALVSFFFFMFSFSTSAQKNNELIHWLPEQDTLSSSPQKKKTPELHKFNRKPDLYDDRNPGADRFHNLPLSPRKRSVQDSIAAKRFPGSERYYAKSLSPYSYGNGFGKSFIIKPDITSKQYLIIIDPLTGKITR